MWWKCIRPTLDEEAIRIEFFGDEIDRITRFDPLTGHAHRVSSRMMTLYPAKQFVTPHGQNAARA